MNKRVSFKGGYQKKFIRYVKGKSNLTWKELSQKLNVNYSTLCKSYLFEACDIPYNVFKNMLKLTKINGQEILIKYKGYVREEKLIFGRKVFGEQKNVFNEINIIFKNKNLNLNTSKINYSKYDKNKNIKIPNKLTPELAEEIGMQFGDGFLSEKRYDYRLKGNPKDEREYYLDYIKPLFKKLYNVDLNIREFEKSFGFELYSQAICEFKIKVLGIKPGKKYDIEFPDTLNVDNIDILSAFIKGLFDTDGSLSFKTKYGYERYYPVIEIMLTSKKVIKEVGGILYMFGFKPWIYFNEIYGRISLYGIGAFKKYEELIGWSNQKNLNKVKEWKRRYPELYNA